MVKLKGNSAAGEEGLQWSLNEAACSENKAPDTHLHLSFHRIRSSLFPIPMTDMSFLYPTLVAKSLVTVLTNQMNTVVMH